MLTVSKRNLTVSKYPLGKLAKEWGTKIKESSKVLPLRMKTLTGKFKIGDPVVKGPHAVQVPGCA